jgi:hypothetical protein
MNPLARLETLRLMIQDRHTYTDEEVVEFIDEIINDIVNSYIEIDRKLGTMEKKLQSIEDAVLGYPKHARTWEEVPIDSGDTPDE